MCRFLRHLPRLKQILAKDVLRIKRQKAKSSVAVFCRGGYTLWLTSGQLPSRIRKNYLSVNAAYSNVYKRHKQLILKPWIVSNAPRRVYKNAGLVSSAWSNPCRI